MMNIMVFDTETTSLDKPFCYNIGYVIATLNDDNTYTICEKKDFIIEQVWHNPMLFSTAYYADKREIYVKSMRARKTKMMKYGYICQEMIRDIKKYNITMAFAYNSPFDDKVFTFNCDWFRVNNPFDNVEIKDIRGFAHTGLVNDYYKEFCEQYGKYTDSGNYSTTAETMYQFITCNPDFVEDHTALSDSMIELEILNTSLHYGRLDITKEYKPLRTIPRLEEKILIIKDKSKETILEIKCCGYTVYKKKNIIQLK